MRYEDFKQTIVTELCAHPAGFTWAELRSRLALPYEQPCPTWVRRLETEIGLTRSRGENAAYIWRIQSP